MPNHTRLDSLSEANLVAQHKARERRLATGTVAQVILVRNHAHARANHASHRRRLPHARKFHGTAATFKSLRRNICGIRCRSAIGFLGLADTRQGTEQVGRPSHLFCSKVGFLHFATTTAYVDNQVIYLAEAFYSERYTLDSAIENASKVAYLSKLLEKDAVEIHHYSTDKLSDLSAQNIQNPIPTKLNKLKKTHPEAFFYWNEIQLLG
jgi:hypothetical protein